MKIEKRLEGKVLNVALKGRLDTITAPELEEDMKEDIKTAKELIFDFTHLEYVSSAGLRVLLRLFKQMKQQMLIRNVNEIVQEVFEATGFADILNIE